MIDNNKQIKIEAKIAFDNCEYPKAFKILWEDGVNDFINYSLKEAVLKKYPNKTNWFSDKRSARYFWEEFILEDHIFEEIFLSENSETIFFSYFTEYQICSPVLEEKLVLYYPELLLKAVRVNQVFLQENKINSLVSWQFKNDFQIHQEFWKKISEIELQFWREINEALVPVLNEDINYVISYCIIWLEKNRFNNNNKINIHHLGSVYSFFIELLLNEKDIPVSKKINSEDFFKLFFKLSIDSFKNKNIDNVVSVLLNNISRWIYFKENVISPYSFDLKINLVQEDELLYLKSTPEAYYKWLLNGTRYYVTQLDYFGQGADFVDKLISKNLTEIPKGKNPGDDIINWNITAMKWSTILLLEDLGIDSFQVGGLEIQIDEIITPLLASSVHRFIRYENSLSNFSQSSSDWMEAFYKLTLNPSTKHIRKEPYFLMSKEEYKNLNMTALKDLPADSTENLLRLFSYKVNLKDPFNRFKNNYDVWQNPFIYIGDNLFCPIMFFANNIWFYAFAQKALTYQYNVDRNETKQMEENFGKNISKKGWKVKVINDTEADSIIGDVDIIAEDNDKTLFIQLKRPYFRLNIKDIYYESIENDIKAAKQLNDAEKYFSIDKTIFNVKNKPIKWIVSTSFENIGEHIDGCLKINYFEFLNALRNPGVIKLIDLIEELSKDKNIKRFAFGIYNEKIPNESKQLIIDTGLPIRLFECKEYKQPIISNEEKKSISAIEMFNDATRLYYEGNKKEALILFQKCIALNNKDGDVWGAMANTLADFKDFNNSISAFQKALECLPDDPYIMRNYALTLSESGNYYKGLVLLLEIFEKYPLIKDLKIEFENQFQICIEHSLLENNQIQDLKEKWDRLN